MEGDNACTRMHALVSMSIRNQKCSASFQIDWWFSKSRPCHIFKSRAYFVTLLSHPGKRRTNGKTWMERRWPGAATCTPGGRTRTQRTTADAVGSGRGRSRRNTATSHTSRCAGLGPMSASPKVEPKLIHLTPQRCTNRRAFIGSSFFSN